MTMNPVLMALLANNANKYKGGDQGKAQKAKDGRNTIRLIAPSPAEAKWVGEDYKFHRDVGVHWIKADEKAKPLAVVGSEEICFDRVSPISAAINAAIASAYDEESKKLYESWKAKAAVLVNVVNRANGEVEVWEMPRTVWGKINDLALLYADQSGVNIFDHASGMDLVITKSGKGLNTQYDVAVSPFMPGKPFPPVTADQIEKASNLDDFIKSNFFRDGDDKKALSAIAQIANVVIPQIGAPVTPTAALTSAGSSVAGANVAQTGSLQATQPTTIDPAVQAAMLAQEQARQAADAKAAEDARQAILASQIAALQAAQAAPAPTPAPVVVQPTEVLTPTTGMSELSADQQADLLAQLAAIGG
ncbi:hypothetical protein [Paracoccus litorisediminis]|uniref:Bacteriophage T4 Gp32 single-stranded DNA-binding domain-containing protein n=1 Tax=Paracoccus litorisediminis TaxID=2006130 RepID=A0A844HMK1_9RHOB|nr:hypothetical protein [Paracoccus litorisediminis]MTH61096.1 hypothetical protein [Paracoccus litorisediminis]